MTIINPYALNCFLLMTSSLVECARNLKSETTNSSEIERNIAQGDEHSEHSAPEWIDESALISVIARPFNSVVKLTCKAKGRPAPKITWTKNGISIDNTNVSNDIYKVKNKIIKYVLNLNVN